jgi:hypothetical protein
VDGGRIDIPSGTYVDLSLAQWQWLAAEGIGPPNDAVPLNQFTYDYMTNNNTIGLGYQASSVRTIPGYPVVPIKP